MPVTKTAYLPGLKLKRYQYRFALRLFKTYQNNTGNEFPVDLRRWLYYDQYSRLRAGDFLIFLSAFELCPGQRSIQDCKRCYDYERCLELFEIINNLADYSPNKTGSSSGSSSGYEPPVVHGKAREVLRLFNLRSLP